MQQSKRAPQPDDAATRLRLIPGGYTLTAWPLHLPPLDDERTNGWLRRISRRLVLTPKTLLQELSPRALAPQGSVASWIHHCDLATLRLGFPMPTPDATLPTRTPRHGWQVAAHPNDARY